jgi:hypothetical protein
MKTIVCSDTNTFPSFAQPALFILDKYLIGDLTSLTFADENNAMPTSGISSRLLTSERREEGREGEERRAESK